MFLFEKLDRRIKDKFNRKELVNRLNHTNSKLKGVGLLSSDKGQNQIYPYI